MTRALHTATRLDRGRYDYRGRPIIRTDWGGEGPRGGTRWVWEVGVWEMDGRGRMTPVLDGMSQHRTLAEAKAAVDAQLD